MFVGIEAGSGVGAVNMRVIFRLWIFGLLVAVKVISPASVQAEDSPTFVLPIACALGETCFIQNYPDIDPGPAVQDYHCGRATYNNHKGTDFRLLSTRLADRGVPVLAAAAGRIKGGRNAEPDRLLGKDTSSVKGRECGNGVVINHGNGWETQYCHMLKGSVQVKRGQRVKAGQRIGRVGYSGLTQFAHLHFSARHNGKTVDPFTGRKLGEGACSPKTRSVLWEPKLATALAYRKGELIDFGFADGPVTSKALETGQSPSSILKPESPALVFFARLINLRAGDRVRISLRGPKSVIAAKTHAALDRSKAQYVAFAGRKRQGEAWPAGTYVGSVQVLRAEGIVLQGRASVALP